MTPERSKILELVLAGSLRGESLDAAEIRNKNFRLASFDRQAVEAELKDLIERGYLVLKSNALSLSKEAAKALKESPLIESTFKLDLLANIARVSYNKGFTDDQERNKTLLRTLLKSSHFTPFEYFQIIIPLNVPIFVARQIMRYRCGTYLEQSLRRVIPQKIKNPKNELDRNFNESLSLYNELLKEGWKKEQARGVLPLSTKTVIIARWNFRELIHIFKERLANDAQIETRQVVQKIYNALRITDPEFIDAIEETGII